jgi:hypothetical protein
MADNIWNDVVAEVQSLALGFIPENVANKSTDGTFAANSDVLYPSQKAAKSYTDAKFALAGTGDVVGPSSAVDGRIALFDGTTGKLIKVGASSLADFQPIDADLTMIAAISPTNDDIIQRKAGAWVNRTMAQLKTDLVLVKADVGLGSVSNDAQLKIASNLSDLANAGTARTNLGVAIGSNVQAWDADLDAIAAISPTNDDIIQRKAGAWVNRTMAQFKTDLVLVKADVGLGSVANVDTTNAANISSGTLPAGRMPALTGDITTSAGAVATVIGAGKVTNAMLAGSIAYSKLSLTGAILNADLAGSIAYSKLSLTGAISNADLAGSITASKLVGSDIATVGTLTSGTWSATAIGPTKGGTGLTSVAQGDLLYGSASNTWSALAKNATATRYLSNTGTSNNPAWAQVDLSSGVTGALGVANGGSGTPTAFTPGSIVFAGASGVYSQDNANLFWDDVNNRLGIGLTTPTTPLHIVQNDGAADAVRGAIIMARYYVSSSNMRACAIFNYNNSTAAQEQLVLAVADTDNPAQYAYAKMVVQANGKIGIGTTNPTIGGTGKLHMAADTVRLDTARTPASASASGNAGEICWDSSYVYVCVATNTWKRSPIATW